MQRAGLKRIPRERSPRSGGAFTLIELLVVVTIIVLLLAMLLPSLNRSIALAERTQCAANERQWGSALAAYASDNFTMMPYNGDPIPNVCPVGGQHTSWNSTIVQNFWASYLIRNNLDSKKGIYNILNCPTQLWHQINDPDLTGGLVGYFYLPGRNPNNIDYTPAGNEWVSRSTLGSSASRFPFIADMKQFGTWNNSWFNSDLRPFSSHARLSGESEGSNMGFEDGHVTWYNSDTTGNDDPNELDEIIQLGAQMGGWRMYYKIAL